MSISERERCASFKLLKFIMHIIYNRAIQDPDKLNQYEPFSPQVYDETSYDLIEMFKKIKLNENDTFVDLGSGKLLIFIINK